MPYSLGEENAVLKCHSKPVEFEMLENDYFWYSGLGKQGHLRVCWLHSSDLCKEL